MKETNVEAAPQHRFGISWYVSDVVGEGSPSGICGWSVLGRRSNCLRDNNSRERFVLGQRVVKKTGFVGRGNTVSGESYVAECSTVNGNMGTRTLRL